jgi:REP element-mobilizing transposase RayT
VVYCTNNCRTWFLTWRTYGTWLPGKEGFVGRYRDGKKQTILQNAFNTPFAPAQPFLQRHAASRMTDQQRYLTDEQAICLEQELIRTCEFRSWTLLGHAIVTNHIHVLLRVAGNPDPMCLIAEFKSYGSRRLNGNGFRQKWWAAGGSTRIVRTEVDCASVLHYINNQAGALRVGICPDAKQLMLRYPMCG